MHRDFKSFPADRRRRQRQPSLLAGKILLVNEVAYDCAIRDISDAGARIRLTCPTPLPDTFQLIDVSHGLAFSASVIWRNLPAVGLQLDQPVDLAAPNAPADLHRLWLECVAR